MKRNLFSILAIFAVVGLLFTTSCTEDDTTAPVVTLNGDNPMTVDFGGTFTDPGATAEDDEDGKIDVVVEGEVNTGAAGEYELIYSATDEAGNVGTAKRTVYVTHRKGNISGNYEVNETFTSNNPAEPNGTWGPFNATITEGAEGNMAIRFNNMGDYGSSVIVNGTLTGNTGQTVTIPQVTTQGLTFEGSGTVNASGTILTINYTADDGTYLYTFTATWEKQ